MAVLLRGSIVRIGVINFHFKVVAEVLVGGFTCFGRLAPRLFLLRPQCAGSLTFEADTSANSFATVPAACRRSISRASTLFGSGQALSSLASTFTADSLLVVFLLGSIGSLGALLKLILVVGVLGDT